MIYIFSGDDTVSSRKAYIDQLEALKKDNEIESVLAKDIDEIKLENIFGSTDLFGKARVLATENLFSGQKSKKKDELINNIASLSQGIFVDWEEKEVSKTEISKLGKEAIVKNFKLPSLLFKFLDDLSPNKISQNLTSFSQITQTLDPGFVFSMIIRQIRLMILAIDGEVDSLPIWQRSKLKNQAKEFGKEKLLKLYNDLLQIDYRQKTSSSAFDLSGEIELLITNF